MSMIASCEVKRFPETLRSHRRYVAGYPTEQKQTHFWPYAQTILNTRSQYFAQAFHYSAEDYTTVKIALIKPPATYANWYRQPALGIAYICACQRAEGYDCEIFDGYFHSWSPYELVEHVTKYGPDIIGITAMTHEIQQAAAIALQLKERTAAPVVIGGCHVTALPERTLSEFPVFDYGVFGEGEDTFVELVRHIQGKTSPHIRNIRGLVFRDNSGVVVNEARPFFTEEKLNLLPYPAIDHYYANSKEALAHPNSYYVMFTSRGCPYKCAFCMQVLGRKVRRRSTESIIGEMKYAVDRYRAHTFNFADEIFLFDNLRTRKLLESFVENGFPRSIKWSALTRANFVTPGLVALAKKAGCVRLEMGVESGDDRILQVINKAITVEQVEKAVKIIKDAGISLGTYYILGHPNENSTTLRKTVDLAVKLNTDSIAVGLMVPYPGTRIFDLALQGKNGYRLLSQNWSEYDKYGGKVLEVEGLPYAELAKWQRRTYLRLYLMNRRFKDCFEFFWKRRKGMSFVLKKKLLSLLRIKNRNDSQHTRLQENNKQLIVGRIDPTK